MTKRTVRAIVVAVAILATYFVVPAHAQDADIDKAGLYHQLAGSRVADTRDGSGFGRGRVRAGETVAAPVLGRGGVPADGVSAVVVNITAIDTSKVGHVTVFASGSTPPATSDLNFSAGWTGTRTVNAQPGADGKVAFSTNADLDLTVDVIGWYASADSTAPAGMTAHWEWPHRVADTRRKGVLLQPGETLEFGYGTTDEPDPVPADHKVAHMVTVTATDATGPGWIGAVSPTGAKPTVPSVTFRARESVANTTNVPLRLREYPTGEKSMIGGLYNGGQSAVHVVVDEVGHFDPIAWGYRYVPMTPFRIVDSRTGLGTSKRAFGAQETRVVNNLPESLQGEDTGGFVGTIAGISPDTTSYVSLWDNDPSYDRPGTSVLNLPAGHNRSNGFSTGYRLSGKWVREFALYNHAGITNLLVDVTGRWDQVLGAKGGAVRSSEQTRDHDPGSRVVRVVDRAGRVVR